MVKPYHIGSSAIYEHSNLTKKSGKNKTIPLTKNASILRPTTITSIQNEMSNDSSETVNVATSTVLTPDANISTTTTTTTTIAEPAATAYTEPEVSTTITTTTSTVSTETTIIAKATTKTSTTSSNVTNATVSNSNSTPSTSSQQLSNVQSPITTQTNVHLAQKLQSQHINRKMAAAAPPRVALLAPIAIQTNPSPWPIVEPVFHFGPGFDHPHYCPTHSQGPKPHEHIVFFHVNPGVSVTFQISGNREVIRDLKEAIATTD